MVDEMFLVVGSEERWWLSMCSAVQVWGPIGRRKIPFLAWATSSCSPIHARQLVETLFPCSQESKPAGTVT